MKKSNTKMYQEVFDLIDALLHNNISVLSALDKLSKKELEEFYSRLNELIEKEDCYPKSFTSDPYSFLANTGLSGIDGNKFDRLDSIHSLSRFSILFANSVHIRSPLNTKFHMLSFEPEKQIAFEIDTLLEYRPLLEQGIIKIAHNKFPIPEGTDPVKLEITTQSTIQRASKALYENYSSQTEFNVSYIKKNDIQMTFPLGPFELISNPSTIPGKGTFGQFSTGNSPTIKNLLEKGEDSFFGKKICVGETGYTNLFDRLIKPIIMDLSFMSLTGALYGLNYITNREADSVALGKKESNQETAINNKIWDAFAHEIPIVTELSIDKLMNIRNNEWDSFLVYRDALNNALKTARDENPKSFKEIFNDMVSPELNKINRLYKETKRSVIKNSSKKVIYTAGALSIGLLSGFVDPTLTQTILSLGGIKFGADIAQGVDKLIKTPEEIKNEQYYFLWKLKNKSN